MIIRGNIDLCHNRNKIRPLATRYILSHVRKTLNECLLAILALIVKHSIYRAIHAAPSPTAFKCTCIIKRGGVFNIYYSYSAVML